MEDNIASPAALIGDPARSAMLLALMGGRMLPATALAWIGGVSPQAASNHLAKLVDGGLLAVTRQGRHRYYRLAGPQVAHVLEALTLLGPLPKPLEPPISPKARRLREGRTCYDHLAGRLGVALADALETQGIVTFAEPDGYELTGAGRARLVALGVDLSRGEAVRACVDWTERRRHLAGPLAARLLDRMFELAWLERAAGTRAAVLTSTGRRGLQDNFGLALDAAAAA